MFKGCLRVLGGVLGAYGDFSNQILGFGVFLWLGLVGVTS